jgi:hypothetical protein
VIDGARHELDRQQAVLEASPHQLEEIIRRAADGLAEVALQLGHTKRGP